MKATKIFIPASLIIVMLIGVLGFTHNKTTLKNPANTPIKGFALVELFTSEGCSSCPPADRLAAKIQKQYQDEPVYILAYHVDYWNSLGWKDAFSNPEYSKRQRTYAAYLKIDGVYTPQMVVNGKTEFVGSDEKALQNAIHNNLEKPAAENLSVSCISLAESKVGLQYLAGGNTKNSSLLIAFVQKSAQSQVKAGENSGQMLAHINIVRKLQSITLDGKTGGTASITTPDGFNPQGWDIIGFIQNTSTGEIAAAQNIVLKTAGGHI